METTKRSSAPGAIALMVLAILVAVWWLAEPDAPAGRARSNYETPDQDPRSLGPTRERSLDGSRERLPIGGDAERPRSGSEVAKGALVGTPDSARDGPESNLGGTFDLPRKDRQLRTWARKNLNRGPASLVEIQGVFPNDAVEIVVEHYGPDGVVGDARKCETIRLSERSILVLIPVTAGRARVTSICLSMMQDADRLDSAVIPMRLPSLGYLASSGAQNHVSSFIAFPYAWSRLGRVHQERLGRGMARGASLRVAKKQLDAIAGLLRKQFELEATDSTGSPASQRSATRILESNVRRVHEMIDGQLRSE